MGRGGGRGGQEQRDSLCGSTECHKTTRGLTNNYQKTKIFHLPFLNTVNQNKAECRAPGAVLTLLFQTTVLTYNGGGLWIACGLRGAVLQHPPALPPCSPNKHGQLGKFFLTCQQLLRILFWFEDLGSKLENGADLDLTSL